MSKSGGEVLYDNQNFLEMTCIQTAPAGYAVIIVGSQLAKQYGAGTAICSIILGNLIVWIIAIAMIAMVDKTHSNAIDNFKSYVGKYGGILAALILMLAILNWYALQINGTIIELDNLYEFKGKFSKDIIIRFGAVLGLISAMVSIGGIRLLKKLTGYSLPFLFCYQVYGLITGHSVPIEGTWGLSFQAVLTAVFIVLPGVINFPTFFRHSRSKAHSFLTLTLMTIIVTFFEISTIWMRFSFPPGSTFDLALITIFLLIIVILSNFYNIYIASASWEAIVPHFGGGKGFAIIGLVGTLVYTFVQITSPIEFFEELTNCYIANLGIVLLMAYITRIIIKHRLRAFEKSINMATWLFGSGMATFFKVHYWHQGSDCLLKGINSSILFFIVVIFIEETVWAIRMKMGKKALKAG